MSPRMHVEHDQHAHMQVRRQTSGIELSGANIFQYMSRLAV